MAVAPLWSLMTLTAAARLVPPVILMLYSPSARQSAPPVEQGVFVVPCVLNEKRGSKAFDELGWIGVANVYVFAVPVPFASGVKVIVGVTAVAPRFCTSNVRNVACTEAMPSPRFWMMNGVTKRPKKRRVMFGRYTVFAPDVKPSYESASARSPLPWCSFTTPTTVEP